MEHLDAAEISRFLKGQLAPERASVVERHLATCATCAELLSSNGEERTEVTSELESSYATAANYQAQVSPAEPAREPSVPRWVLEGRPPDRGEQVGRYLVLERVGQGGMGIVYSAWDPDLGRRVAIKLLRTDKQHAEGRTVGQARLLREAQAMARVSHPNVIPVFDVGTFGEGVFVAMEFIDGTTLKKWIKEKSHSWREVLDTFAAAGRGLAGAHAVGLVHRDFKPDNVLISKDGRVRVTDFGLARLAEEGAEPRRPALPEGAPPDEVGPELAQLTQDGHAVGTLMYMSPEQRRGEAPDARADQFSFCVALYWALFGTWPFERQRSQRDPDYSPASSQKGTSRPSQRTEDSRPVDPSTGAFEPPRDSKVPASIRRALMRGLAPDPKDRFSSMDDLLARLEYRPRMVRVAAAAAAAVLVAGAGSYAWYAQQEAQRQALLCTGAEQQLAGIWDDGARRQVTDALVATGKPEAADVASRVTRMLDEYTRGWVEASTDACRATRIRGEQTEQLLSLRVVCLDRRLKDVKAVTGVLAAADAELVPKATDTVALLPSLRGCADVTSLSQVEPPPDSPQAREEISRISSEVARLKALTDAGKYKPAKELAEPTVKAASALGYRPLEGEALFWQGVLEARSGEPVASERHLTQAVWAALASRDDVVLTRAASTLVFAVGFDPKRHEDSLRWAELAKASLARMGGNDEIEAELFNYLGVAYNRQNKLPESLTALQRALQLMERALGADHVRRASILGNMGNVYRKEGKYEDAVRVTREAIAIRERVNGPNHPLVGFLHYSLAQALTRVKDLEQAQAHADRSLEIHLATFGPEHPETASAYDLVGELYLIRDKYKEAQAAYQRALEIKEKTVGKNHVTVSYTATGVALAHQGLGDPARALPFFERAAALSQDPPNKGTAYFGMAKALDSLKRKPPEVLAAAQKAREAYASVKDQKMVEEINTWIAQHPASKGAKPARRR
jgi:serine/threonine protein kinase/tetratricopeptide (TPR) repeat protein